LRILLADDSKAVALPVIESLQQQGHQVIYVQDGCAAVEAYQADPPDLVLMDVMMPNMDGIEATRRIKALGGGRWVPLLIMTSLSSKEEVMAGLDAGADDYLLKPIVFEFLDARVRSMQRLATMQDSLLGILDNVYDAILTIDEVGIVQTYNSAAERIFGYGATEVLGKNVKMLMPPPYTDEHDGYLARYLRERSPRVIGIGRKVQGCRKNGDVFPMRLAVTEIHTTTGYQFIGLVSDISEEENARARAEASALAVAQSENFLKTITDAMPGLVAYWDKDLRCGFANKPYQEWFGKLPQAVIGTTMMELMGERLFALNEPHIRGVLTGQPQRFERTLTKADGSLGFTLVNYIPDKDANGSVVGFFVLVSDVTVLKQAEVELKLAASVFENTIEGIFVTDGNGVILSVNPAFTSITGFTADEAIGRTPRILRSDRHDEAFYAAVWRDIAAKGQWQGQIWNRRKDGETFLEWQTITKIPAPEGEPVRYISVFNDITELWRKDEYIRHLAFHDALTDLPNRALLMERLNHQTAIAKREQRLLAVMFLDLDRFKFVNDNFGHDVGDDLLKAVAQKLLALVRQSDTVARLGGDEFVIVLNNPESQAEVTHIADRVVAVINEPMEFCGKSAQVGTSIGIAMYPTNGDTPAELIKSADTAMYAAKAAGKNTHRFFNVDMVAGY
jgi:diguanylate cyclase (GGDEF)-like protein/PAS domain S-box-containing protein